MAEQDTDETRSGATKISDAWIFVSHSTKDLDLVRKIRDEMESLGANPILFFLKSVTDDHELDGLIKREIAARNIFFLCDSDHARRSKWVQDELAIVASLRRQSLIKVHSISLNSPWETQRAVIHLALKAATIFLSYSWNDKDLVCPYIDFLTSKDLAVFSHDQVKIGENWQSRLETEIKAAAFAGYFIVFLSESFFRSRWSQAEFSSYLDTLHKRRAAIPPIFVALDATEALLPRLPNEVQQYKILDASHGGVTEIGSELLRALGFGHLEDRI